MTTRASFVRGFIFDAWFVLALIPYVTLVAWILIYVANRAFALGIEFPTLILGRMGEVMFGLGAAWLALGGYLYKNLPKPGFAFLRYLSSVRHLGLLLGGFIPAYLRNRKKIHARKFK